MTRVHLRQQQQCNLNNLILVHLVIAQTIIQLIINIIIIGMIIIIHLLFHSRGTDGAVVLSVAHHLTELIVLRSPDLSLQ